MKPIYRALVAINLLLMMAWFAWSINEKETLLAEGELLLFELAPVDPRSLIQGDYMTLSYAVGRGWRQDSFPKTGYIVVNKDENGIARKLRLQPATSPLSPGEYVVNYTSKRWRLNIGAESYFFEEGQGARFNVAKYGGVRIDGDGNSLLVGLYDEERRFIEP